MDDQQFLDALIKSFEDSGLQVMPQDEFDEWLQNSDAYHASNEAKSLEMLENVRLDYYLDKIARYKFKEGMGEISGFGGSYEKACRAMLDAGLRWFDDNPDANPQYKGFEGVYGILSEDNEDAKALSSAVTSVVDNCTGAMHQAVASSVLFIRKNGWDKYVGAMSDKEPAP